MTKAKEKKEILPPLLTLESGRFLMKISETSFALSSPNPNYAITELVELCLMLRESFIEGFIPHRNNPEIIFLDNAPQDELGNSRQLSLQTENPEIIDQDWSNFFEYLLEISITLERCLRTGEPIPKAPNFISQWFDLQEAIPSIPTEVENEEEVLSKVHQISRLKFEIEKLQAQVKHYHKDRNHYYDLWLKADQYITKKKKNAQPSDLHGSKNMGKRRTFRSKERNDNQLLFNFFNFLLKGRKRGETT